VRPRVGVRVVAEDPARDGLAFDAVHDESAPEVVFRPQQHAHRGDRDAGRGRGLAQVVFRRPIGFAPVRARIAPQDEPATPTARVGQVERPCLAGRAARKPAQVQH